ncbi:MAG: hypothetical protein AAFX04_01045 [Pseudomonadota bacterium]
MEDLLESFKVTQDSQELLLENAASHIDTDEELSLSQPEDSKVEMIEAAVEERRIVGGPFRGIYWDLPANNIWRLAINGRPLVANYFNFSISNLGWRAGRGWPWYTTPCPRGGRAGRGFAFPGSPPHATCLIVGGNAFTNCHMSGWARGAGRSQVVFGVNDDNYSDNTGGFRLHLNGWS